MGGVPLPNSSIPRQHELTLPAFGTSMAGPGTNNCMLGVQQKQLHPVRLQSQLAWTAAAASPAQPLQQQQQQQQQQQHQQQVQVLVVTEQQLQALQCYQQQQQQLLQQDQQDGTAPVSNMKHGVLTVAAQQPQPSQQSHPAAAQHQQQYQPRLLQHLIRQQLQAASGSPFVREQQQLQAAQHGSSTLAAGSGMQTTMAVKAECSPETAQATPMGMNSLLVAIDTAQQQQRQQQQQLVAYHNQEQSSVIYERQPKRGSEGDTAPAKRTCIRDVEVQHGHEHDKANSSPPGTPCSTVKQPNTCPSSTTIAQQQVGHVNGTELACLQNTSTASMPQHHHPNSSPEAAGCMPGAVMAGGTMVTVGHGQKMLLATAQGTAAVQGVDIHRTAAGSGSGSWDTSLGSIHSVLTTEQQEQLVQFTSQAAKAQQHHRPGSDSYSNAHTIQSMTGHAQQQMQVQAVQQQQQAPALTVAAHGTQAVGQVLSVPQGAQLLSVVQNGQQCLVMLPAGMQLSTTNGVLQVVSTNQQATTSQPILRQQQQQQGVMQAVHVQDTGSSSMRNGTYAAQPLQAMQLVNVAPPEAHYTQQQYQVAPQMGMSSLYTGLQAHGMVLPSGVINGVVRAAAGEVAMPYMQRVATRAQVEAAMAEVVEVMRHKPRGRPVKYIDLGVNRMALKYHVGVRLAGRVESMGATDTELAAHMLMDMVKIGLGLYLTAAAAVPPSTNTHPEEQMTNQLAQHPSSYSTAFVQRVIAQLVNRSLIPSSELGSAYMRAQAAGCVPGPCFASVSAALSAFS